MFPLRDTIRSRTIPMVTWLIIAVNTLVFIFETSLAPQALDRLVSLYGLVPARLNIVNPLALVNQPAVMLTFVTSQFLHGGWLHLISNMWTLFIFGDNVEDRLGSGRYLLFYLFGGIAAGLLQVLVMPTSRIPSVGASGAIAGVLGAYFLLYPRARVITLIPVFIFPWFVEIWAFVYLGFWFLLQLYSGVFSLGSIGGADMGGIAWWAHIGGFLFGVLTVRLIAPRRNPVYTRQYLDDYWPW
jgi:membrane associated rhomboid family serine protease